MAKRAGAKPKKRSAKASSKPKTVKRQKPKSPTPLLSTDQYNRLLTRASEARKSIRTQLKNPAFSDVTLPDPDDYKIKRLIERIEKGATNRDLLRELDAIKKAPSSAVPFTNENGYTIPASTYQDILKAIERANKNIENARKKLPDIAKDVIPPTFDKEGVLSSIYDDKGVKNLLDDLSLFKPSKLKIKAINDAAEAGTDAEVEYYKRILQRENERRAKLRDERGVFGLQSRFQRADDEGNFMEDIDINNIKSKEELKRKGQTWSDPARIARANKYLENYHRGIDALEEFLLNHNMLNDTARNKINRLRDAVDSYINHEDAITTISFDEPDAAIDVVYPKEQTVAADIDDLIAVWERHAPE